MSNFDWLSKIKRETTCGNFTQQLWAIEVDKKRWVFATEGHIVVALPLPKDSKTEECPTEKDRATHGQRFLSRESGGRHIEVPGTQLLAWCTPGRLLRCPCCNGTGIENPFNEDEVIGNDPHQHGVIAGVTVNRVLLAWPLYHLRDLLSGRSQVDIYIPEEISHPVRIFDKKDKWRIAIMAMNYKPDQCEDNWPVLLT